MNEKHERCSAETAASHASRWNGAMSAAQMVVAGATGNVGFAVESAHNAADAASFDAKRRAMNCDPRKSMRLRKLAATILTIGGIAGVGGASYYAASGKSEEAGIGALGIATAGAAINTRVALRTHGAHSHHDDDHAHSHGAHEDSKLHTLTDAGTGWLYVGGLALEHKFPGIANYFVMVNGAVITSAGLKTWQNINATKPDGEV